MDVEIYRTQEGAYPLITEREKRMWDRRLPYSQIFFQAREPDEQPMPVLLSSHIPANIFEEIANCSELNGFREYEIRSAAARGGETILFSRDANDIMYVLARWGNELRPIGEIAASARKGARPENRSQLAEKMLFYIGVPVWISLGAWLGWRFYTDRPIGTLALVILVIAFLLWVECAGCNPEDERRDFFRNGRD